MTQTTAEEEIDLPLHEVEHGSGLGAVFVVRSPQDEAACLFLFRDGTDVRGRLRRGIQWNRTTESARHGAPPLRSSQQRSWQRWDPVLRLGLSWLVGPGAMGSLRRV